MRLTDYRLIDQWNVDDEFDCLTPTLWHKSDIHTGITGNSCGMVLHRPQLLVTVTVCRGVDAESGFVVGQAKRKTRPGYNHSTTSESANGRTRALGLIRSVNNLSSSAARQIIYCQPV